MSDDPVVMSELENRSSCIYCGKLTGAMVNKSGTVTPIELAPKTRRFITQAWDGTFIDQEVQSYGRHACTRENRRVHREMLEDMILGPEVVVLPIYTGELEKLCLPYSVDCPVCEVKIGERCVNMKPGPNLGNANKWAHKDRNYAALESRGYRKIWHRTLKQSVAIRDRS